MLNNIYENKQIQNIKQNYKNVNSTTMILSIWTGCVICPHPKKNINRTTEGQRQHNIKYSQGCVITVCFASREKPLIFKKHLQTKTANAMYCRLATNTNFDILSW